MTLGPIGTILGGALLGLGASKLLSPKTPDYSSMFSAAGNQQNAVPTAPAAPEAPTAPDASGNEQTSQAMQAAEEEERRKRAAEAAANRTNYTGGLGVTSPANISRKTLLG